MIRILLAEDQHMVRGALAALSEGTVRNYLSSAIGKTGARNRIEALRLARDKGWI
jgi:two-component system, NarL family, response regulator DesR